MEGTLTLRPMKREDLPAVQRLVMEAWDYPRYYPRPLAALLAREFCVECLATQNRAQVACRDGRLLGVIMGRWEAGFSPRQVRGWRLRRGVLRGLLRWMPAGGSQGLQLLRQVQQIDSQLLGMSGAPQEAEVVLLAVDQAARGQGIGKQLLQSLEDWLRRQGAGSCYLFTDTTCSYRFYHAVGYRRAAEQTVRLPLLDKEVGFFLYRKELAAPQERHL